MVREYMRAGDRGGEYTDIEKTIDKAYIKKNRNAYTWEKRKRPNRAGVPNFLDLQVLN